ncbi:MULTISPECIES: hypothetical protein [unclassified Robiginitalea]|uniref:hypothetical protein n=1 Tax=Robiginitalea TaxID=252306 RepID=UPI0023498E66|nr:MULTISPECIES: hypothetical protein [unclassified Robiginitalea]MDC6353697.1 hypothetical protein [Robiginitalea sp. PM2]MDC6375771.1 hypothetical protein [Robiginitalea sp. SP8]
MKEKDNTLESLFGELRGAMDHMEPSEGHRERFNQRLGEPAAPKTRRQNLWGPLALAASFALLITASVFLFRPDASMEEQVAEISPEASRTSYYFANLVRQQVGELEALSSPETRPLIDDALRQLGQLEADYGKLESDLVSGGNSKLILSAMINNFQTRIDLLQEVMQQIEQIKQFKNANDETNTL